MPSPRDIDTPRELLRDGESLARGAYLRLMRWEIAYGLCALVLAPALVPVVAWMLILEQPLPGHEARLSAAAIRETWDAHVPGGDAAEVVVLRDATDFIGYRRVRIQGGPVPPASLVDPRHRTLKVERAGFPFEAVGSERRWGRAGTVLEGAIPIAARPMSSGNYGVVDGLPYRPVWPGFALNTWLYFTLLLTPLGVARWAMRRNRRRRSVSRAHARATG